MDREGENRIVWAFFIIFIAVIAVSLLFGCKTKKVIETVTEHVHDTVQVHHSDTVREVKVSHHTDTVKQIETHTYTLNNVGDTVKEIHHFVEVNKMIVVDSTYRYKARMDSLERALKVEKDKNKEKVVTKTKYVIRWCEYAILFALVGGCIFFVLKRGGKTFVDKI